MGVSYGRAVAKIVCTSNSFGHLLQALCHGGPWGWDPREERYDTLVQYAACLWLLPFSFLFGGKRGGSQGTIRFRLLWWGWCFKFQLFYVSGTSNGN